MRPFRFLTALTAVALLGFVGCKSAEEIEKEKKALEAEQTALKGDWKFDRSEGDAEEGEGAKADSKGLHYIFDGDKLREEWNGKAEHYYRVTLRPMSDPKQIDLTETDEKGTTIQVERARPVKKKGRTEWVRSKADVKRIGVYKIEGNTLTINLSWDDKDRPSGFTAPAGKGYYVQTFKKAGGQEKPADKDDKKDPKKDDKKDPKKDPKKGDE